jgi:hypothetical protein
MCSSRSITPRANNLSSHSLRRKPSSLSVEVRVLEFEAWKRDFATSVLVYLCARGSKARLISASLTASYLFRLFYWASGIERAARVALGCCRLFESLYCRYQAFCRLFSVRSLR